MALWKESTQKEPFLRETERPEVDIPPLEPIGRLEAHTEKKAEKNNRESVIAAGLTIEGKIEGGGDVRVAGRFDGNVQVRGDLNIESGAHISGEIRADTITIGGEVEGNIDAAAHVRLLETGQLIGDLKATSLTVAAGSRMRGKVEFGWDGREAKKVEIKKVADRKVVEKTGNGSTP